MLLDRKFVVISIYGIGAVVSGAAYMVGFIEHHGEFSEALPGALERAAFWPVFIFTSFNG